MTRYVILRFGSSGGGHDDTMPAMKKRYRLARILGLLFLAGCGQTGPLYLPDNTSQIRTQAPSQEQSQTNEDDANKEKESRDE